MIPQNTPRLVTIWSQGVGMRETGIRSSRPSPCQSVLIDKENQHSTRGPANPFPCHSLNTESQSIRVTSQIRHTHAFPNSVLGLGAIVPVRVFWRRSATFERLQPRTPRGIEDLVSKAESNLGSDDHTLRNLLVSGTGPCGNGFMKGKQEREAHQQWRLHPLAP